MQATNNNNAQETTQEQQTPATTQAATDAAGGEEQKTFAERMATMTQPKVDTRVKTEDVTGTTGLTFRDFNLAESVQFVSVNQSIISFYPLSLHPPRDSTCILNFTCAGHF